jgi:hypothetical protein
MTKRSIIEFLYISASLGQFFGMWRNFAKRGHTGFRSQLHPFWQRCCRQHQQRQLPESSAQLSVSIGTRVTGRVCEKVAQNVAQPVFCPN